MSDSARLIFARGLRGLADGALVILVSRWLVDAGRAGELGTLTFAALLGSALATLAAGLVAHRLAARSLLVASCALLALTGVGMAFAPSPLWLLAIVFVGTFNPGDSDLSLFLPIEQALLAETGDAEGRASRFAYYNVAGALGMMLGSQAAGLLAQAGAGAHGDAQLALIAYAACGALLAALYAPLRVGRARAGERTPAQPLRESRGVVLKLSALFTLDSFGGGFSVRTLVIAWLIARHDASVAQVALAMSVASGLSAASQLAAPLVARRIGLIRTMVYTHIPANCFMIALGFMPTLPLAIACLWLRASLSQMDVPARQAYVMSVVPEGERAAAASVTNVPRAFGGAPSALIAGPMLAAGAFQWALATGGVLKIAYDLLLLAGFGHRPAPHETRDA
ncbi:MAG: MFS transporter [Deltaproteobacteria bacterium]|nr:MFS transporter [Deltaproteobacteria bacterium]